MRNKKLLSTVVASALVATTMAMPVMAEDGGQVDVDVTTRTSVIRVAVPTSLEVAVNQFEKGDDGSQIYSQPFTIQNKSEIPVQVTVDSELKMNANVKLSETKAAAIASTEANGEAWLAAAAQIEAGKYIDGADKGLKDLTEANENVATFVQDGTTKTKATTQQTFYLNKADNVSTLTYTTFVPKENGKADVNYAQFYVLTQVSFTAAADPDNPTPDEQSTWQEELEGALAAGDVYEIAATADSVAGGGSLTLHQKGATGVTYAATNNYYTMASAVTAVADLVTTSKYAYTETADGGSGAFRYIGKLSESKATWTATDFEKVTIKYGILGATTTKYNTVKDDCTYGLYTPVTGPQVSFTNDGAITISGLTSGQTVTGVSIAYTKDGSQATDDLLNNQNMTWNTDKTSGTMNSNWTDYLQGCGSVTVTVSLSGDVTKTATATF